jgi:short-subunit dehydrogenase
MNILILGATSAMAQATAKQWASTDTQFFVVARGAKRLQTIADDLQARTQNKTHTFAMDANDTEKHAACITEATKKMGSIDLVLIAHGTLSDQSQCEQNVALLRHELETNALSTVMFLTLIANELEKQKHGTIVVITSVAGDRGRQSNYVYGAAKAMVETFAQGLRQRLAKQNVHVLSVKPGFTDTPMTQDIKKGLLWAQPEKIAKDIVRAVKKKKNVIYTPCFWWGIMTIIKCIPECIFKKLSL